MANEKTGFLEEAPNETSYTRVANFITLISGIVITCALAWAGITAYLKPDSHETLLSVAQAISLAMCSFVLPLAIWKVGQKFAENKEVK